VTGSSIRRIKEDATTWKGFVKEGTFSGWGGNQKAPSNGSRSKLESGWEGKNQVEKGKVTEGNNEGTYQAGGHKAPRRGFRTGSARYQIE